MTDLAIRVEGLSKQYRIGKRERYATLYDRLSATLAAPFRRLRSTFQRSNVQPSNEDSIWALKDVSFDVKHGEVVGVIGRNGAGKSTLLKILSRITAPTEGRAEVFGRVGSLLEVGTGFHPELTGRENIYLNGAILGMRKAEIDSKFDEIVAFSEVEKFLDTPVRHYSSGMHVRLAFAVAAHLEPEILLVDEVLAVGDAAFQKKCLGKMGEVAKGGRTVLFVSHNMGAVSALCGRTIHLADGMVRGIGPSGRIVSDYLSELFQGSVNDLDRLRSPGYGMEVRFCDIQLSSNDRSNILFGEPLEFALSIRADTDLKDLSLGSSIFTSFGTCVGTLFTEKFFSIRANQRLTLHLRVSNVNLAPGSYYAGFSIGHGGREAGRYDYDIVIGRPTFQVLPIAGSTDMIANWNSGWGNIVLRDTQLTLDED